ncbi:hypothetical protein HGA88_01705 [Candidatus Roizmanbacteria bacterium]|nr:hypothetical protein [Candidatus Roizmanbacteria bacterium]
MWHQPHISKIYEALTAITDKRIEMVSENEARCYSSSRGKYYTITYDSKTNAIMSNDNTAYFTGAISYPMIAFLMLKGIVPYNQALLSPLSNIVWKDIMQKHKNNYDKGIAEVLEQLAQKGIDTAEIQAKIHLIFQQVCSLSLVQLGQKIFPPKAY